MGHDHYYRWHGNLLQGLGNRSAHRVQPRLAAVGRRLGHADAVLLRTRLPRHRARPARPRPSTQVGDGHDMDHYADDLAALTAHLDLQDAIHVGHSTGGGEVARYLARHGESRVAKAAIISAVPPLMVKGRSQSGRPAERSLRRLSGAARANRRSSTATSRRTVLQFQPAGCEASEAISRTGGARA